MNLIQRAVGNVPADNDKIDKPANTNDVAQTDAAIPSPQEFELDLARLGDAGFFVPSDKPQRLPQELRAIKRRLLRRLKFYKSGARAQRRSQLNLPEKNLVLVTSTSPEEGKTYTSINLALSLALEDNVNVLLIDADVPRPRVCYHLGVKNKTGLTDKIKNKSLSLQTLVRKHKHSSLSLLTEGTGSERASEFFAKPELSDLFTEIGREYRDHIVIIDAPPILAAPGTSLLSQYADEVVYVVRANKTPEPAIVSALDEVLDYNENVSLILNYTRVPGKFSHYGSYGEYYYQEERGVD